jgi:hypothetical protein
MQNTEPMGKDENIAFRTSPEIKQILERLAKEGYRSLSQQCEMIIIQWLKEHGHMEGDEKERSVKTPSHKEEMASRAFQDDAAKYGQEPE